MKRTVALSVLAAAAIAAGGAAIAATAGESGRGFVVIEHIMSSTDVDLGEQGPSQGDRWVYQSDILDESGKRLGAGGGECALSAPQGTYGLTHCLGHMSLQGGQIVFSGMFDFDQASGVVAITGGTGQYASASGTLAFKQVEKDTYRDEIHLAG